MQGSILGRVLNAFTLVPTVFLRNRKTEFELPVPFFIHPRYRKSVFVFRFPTTLKMEFGPSAFVFCFPTTLDNRILIVISSSVFVRYWKTKFDLRFSFFVYAFLSLPHFTWIGRMERNIEKLKVARIVLKHLQRHKNASYKKKKKR